MTDKGAIHLRRLQKQINLTGKNILVHLKNPYENQGVVHNMRYWDYSTI